MRAGYNFDVSYIYWYTNGAVVIPTNFDVAQVATIAVSNQTLVINAPVSSHGTNISPPIWQGWTNPISEPAAWPNWALPDGYPKWPLWIANADGALVIASSAQLPICRWTQLSGDIARLRIQGLPGAYTIQSSPDLAGLWHDETNVVAGPDGTADISFPVARQSTLFIRAKGIGPSIGVGFTARFETRGRKFEPAVFCDGGTPQEFLWTWSDGTTSTSFPLASKNFGSRAIRAQYLKVYFPDLVSAINLGFDGSDGGETTLLDTNSPPQDVSSVYFPFPLTGLRYWASSYNPVGDTLDFTGFSSLEAIECFHCTNLEHVAIANLPSLKRICFEQCDLQE